MRVLAHSSLHSHLLCYGDGEVPSARDVVKEVIRREVGDQDISSMCLLVDGMAVGSDTDLLQRARGGRENGLLVVRVAERDVNGGKGGFGALLRIQSKLPGAKKTSDFSACRDLSGRRLRHVNDEKIMQKWNEAKNSGKEFDVDQETTTGINMWFLGIPTWAKCGFKKGSFRRAYMKERRKTSLCKEWQSARDKRSAPASAPPWWGCPRGRRCEFAHGIAELRGEAQAAAEEAEAQSQREEREREKDKYFGVLLNSFGAHADEEQLNDMVLEGLRKAKRAKRAPSDEEMVSAAASAVSASSSTTEPLAAAAAAADDEWIAPVGQSDIIVGFDGEVEGGKGCAFSTAQVCAVLPLAGEAATYYYEAEVLTEGLMQIGFIDDGFVSHVLSSSSGKDEEVEVEGADGVGDTVHSWAYDGLRGQKWHVEGSDYPLGDREPWRAGDVVGCMLELSEPSPAGAVGVTVSFACNGEALGTAFAFTVDISSSSSRGGVRCFYPAVSVEEGEALLINIGQHPFRLPAANGSAVRKPLDTLGSSLRMKASRDALIAAANKAAAAAASSSSSETVAEGTQAVQGPIDIESDQFDSIEKLLAVGADSLKQELVRRGLKCGGTAAERAARLLAVRGKAEHEVDPKLRAVAKK